VYHSVNGVIRQRQASVSPAFLLRESAMKNERASAINPGKVVFSKKSQFDSDGSSYKIIFCCRKSGFDFLGQTLIIPDAAKLKVELFNAGFFELFDAEREDVQTALEGKALAVLLRRDSLPGPCRAIVRAFISEKRGMKADAAVKDIEPEAGKDNLAAIYEKLNREYFNGDLDAEIQWGKDRKTPNRRSFSFGSYDPKNKLVRIHPRLKQEFVPMMVLELTIYHEMCHQSHPPFKNNGQWLTHHGEFRRKEREYANYRQAMAWEKANWIKLLMPAEEAPAEKALAQ